MMSMTLLMMNKFLCEFTQTDTQFIKKSKIYDISQMWRHSNQWTIFFFPLPNTHSLVNGSRIDSDVIVENSFVCFKSFKARALGDPEE